MTLSTILGSAASGLITSQEQLRVISDNVSNVNTPGYARKQVDQQSISLSTMGGGVSAGLVKRSVDQFLQQASLSSTGQAGQAGVVSDFLDRAQSGFGDPTTQNGYFNQLDKVFSAFSASAQDPASTVSRNQALSDISNFLDQSASISGQLGSLSQEADKRIGDNVNQVNNLLSQIAQLNTSIIRDGINSGDTTGAENSQSQLIDQLSSMIDVAVAVRPDRSIDLRGGGGELLVGRAGAASLSYTTSGSSAGQLMVTIAKGSARPLLPTDGAIKGLLDLRNTEIPAISTQLGEYVTRAADQINAAHNAASAVPPPNTLTGRNTGIDIATSVSGFTGKTTVAVVDPSGTMQTRVDIDFTGGTMTVDGGAPTAFVPATFLATLNAALGVNGTATFANGALTLQASSGNGIAIGDDPTTPSSKAGRGFSQFYGLNDLITTNSLPYPATGLSLTDPNGFNAGGVISLRVLSPEGAPLRDANVTVPAGGTVDDLITALNDPATGIGLYGAYSLDSQGRLTFAPNSPGASVRVTSDTSQTTTGGASATALFGLDQSVRAARASVFQIRPDIAGDSTKLAMAQLDLTATAGSSALSKGDARGALLLAAAGDTPTTFDPAGSLGAVSATLAQYGAQLSGGVAQKSSAASAAKDNANAVATEASTRRSSVEGVNLDEELIKLTTYQQSYNASARMIQAVKDMYDTLMQMVP